MEFDKILQGILGIKHTKFLSVSIPPSNSVGMAIAEGNCKAIRLHFNQYERNSTNATQVTESQIYYGDSNTQEVELLRGQTSHVIVTDRLEYIHVRNPYPDDVWVQIEVMN
jgi:hypothetical protein